MSDLEHSACGLEHIATASAEKDEVHHISATANATSSVADDPQS